MFDFNTVRIDKRMNNFKVEYSLDLDIFVFD